MKRILKTLWFTPMPGSRQERKNWGLNAIFVGPPGSAKTATINAVAAEAGLHMETVLASLRQPDDFLGLPIPVRGDEVDRVVNWIRESVPRAEPVVTEAPTHFVLNNEAPSAPPSEKKMKKVRVAPAPDAPAMLSAPRDKTVTFSVVSYAPPRWAVRAASAPRAVVFLDEINTAPPAVQAALLRVTLDRVVGDLELPGSVRFVGAMNATDDAAGGWDLSPPLANRFGHFTWTAPSAAAWSEYMLDVDGDSAPLTTDAGGHEAQVLTAWGGQYARAIGQMSGYLAAQPHMILQKPPSHDPKASGAWPSPRTCEMAVRAIASGAAHALSPADTDSLVAGFVGESFATSFATYVSENDLPSAAELLDGTVKWTPDMNRLDRTHAVVTACASLVVGEKTNQRNRAGALWKILGKLIAPGVDASGRVSPGAPDLAVPAAQALTRAKLAFGITNADPVLEALGPVLDALRTV